MIKKSIQNRFKIKTKTKTTGRFAPQNRGKMIVESLRSSQKPVASLHQSVNNNKRSLRSTKAEQKQSRFARHKTGFNDSRVAALLTKAEQKQPVASLHQSGNNNSVAALLTKASFTSFSTTACFMNAWVVALGSTSRFARLQTFFLSCISLRSLTNFLFVFDAH